MVEDWKGVLPKSGNILYLGAGNGYTISFLSDLLSDQGTIYAIEFSKIAMRDLLELSQERVNIHPMLEDARRPDRYMPHIPRPDWLFQDVSQRDQIEIFSDHLKYLNKGGQGLLSIKLESMSSDMTRDQIVDLAKSVLLRSGTIIKIADLAPFEKGHVLIHLEKD